MALTIDAFKGIRSLTDFIDGERPESYREGIMRLDIASKAPLNALIQKIESEEVTDDTFHWFEQNIPYQAADITGIYTDSAMTTAVSGEKVAGTVLYIKCSEAQAKEFRAEHNVLIRVSTLPEIDAHASVKDVDLNGDNSKITVVLLSASTTAQSKHIVDADRLLVNGNSSGVGSMPPEIVNYKPQKKTNFIEFFRTPLGIDGRTLSTQTRTGPALKKERQEKLLMHGIEMEKAFWRGKKWEGTDNKGKRKTNTGGIVPSVLADAPQNYFNFQYDTDFAGASWVEAGEEWFDKVLQAVSIYGSDPRLTFGGNGALGGINQVAKMGGQIVLEPGAESYGLRVKRLINVHLDIDFIQHGLFTHEATERNRIVGITPKNLRYRFMKDRDTKKWDDTPPGYDGIIEEYRTDCGLEIHHIETFFVLDGVGLDNLL